MDKQNVERPESTEVKEMGGETKKMNASFIDVYYEAGNYIDTLTVNLYPYTAKLSASINYKGHFIANGYQTRGDQVAMAQTFLNYFYGWTGKGQFLTTDSSYGPATIAQIKVFQKHCGISVDGSVGPTTWDRLVRFYLSYK